MQLQFHKMKLLHQKLDFLKFPNFYEHSISPIDFPDFCNPNPTPSNMTPSFPISATNLQFPNFYEEH